MNQGGEPRDEAVGVATGAGQQLVDEEGVEDRIEAEVGHLDAVGCGHGSGVSGAWDRRFSIDF